MIIIPKFHTWALVYTYPDLPSFETSIKEVYTQVDPFEAKGPDGISPKLLKEIVFELSLLVQHCFQFIIKTRKDS